MIERTAGDELIVIANGDFQYRVERRKMYILSNVTNGGILVKYYLLDING